MQSTVDTLRASLVAYKKAKGKYADLAKTSGIPASTFYKITSGVIKNPGTDSVDKIFRALGVRVRMQ